MSLRKRHQRRVMNRIARKCSGGDEVCGRCVMRSARRLPLRLWWDAGWRGVMDRDVMRRLGLLGVVRR